MEKEIIKESVGEALQHAGAPYSPVAHLGKECHTRPETAQDRHSELLFRITTFAIEN